MDSVFLWLFSVFNRDLDHEIGIYIVNEVDLFYFRPIITFV